MTHKSNSTENSIQREIKEASNQSNINYEKQTPFTKIKLFIKSVLKNNAIPNNDEHIPIYEEKPNNYKL
jgi:hypothetical protein